MSLTFGSRLCSLFLYFFRAGGFCCPFQSRGDRGHGRYSDSECNDGDWHRRAKTSIVSSDRAVQSGELERLKKDNERITKLVKALEDLRVSLQEEN